MILKPDAEENAIHPVTYKRRNRVIIKNALTT